jgi:pyridinium-3,5-biscarboxylic acid mononucleotide synthase
VSLGDHLRELLDRVRDGDLDPEAALVELSRLPYRDLGFARVDVHRELRQGAPEAVLAEGKSRGQVVEIVQAMLDGGTGSVLVTRADDETCAAVRQLSPDAESDPVARCAWIARSLPEPRGLVALISAGTSDAQPLHEARIRAHLLGAAVLVREDIGVAGIHRLFDALPDIERADVVVVAAGMDGALASVVGGLVSVPVIGLPTSAGYGCADGGRTALMAMLASCAAGVAVVGIDDGLGAGTIAAAIARRAHAGLDPAPAARVGTAR